MKSAEPAGQAMSTMDPTKITFILATSMLLYTAILQLLGAVVELSRPYLYGIACSVLFSVVWKDHRDEKSKNAVERAAEKMTKSYHKGRSLAAESYMGNILGGIFSIGSFLGYLMHVNAVYFGLRKMPLVAHSKFLAFGLTSLLVIQLTNRIVLLFFILGVVGLCSAFYLFTAIPFPTLCMSTQTYVRWMTRTVVISALFLMGVLCSYHLAMDVINVQENVVSGFSGAADRVDIKSKVGEYLADFALNEISVVLNHTNVTQMARELNHAFGPLLANLSWEEDWHSQWARVQTTLQNFTTVTNVSTTSAMQNMFLTFREKYAPILTGAFRIVVGPVVSIVYIFSEILVFIYVLRFLVSEMEHTVLYYVLVKVYKVMSTDDRDAHQRAKRLEQNIILQFWTLFQSFAHLVLFHFALSFSVLKYCRFPLPALSALIGVAPAVFPVFPDFVTTCGLAFALQLYREPFAPQILLLAVAWRLQWFDEWLLKIEDGKGNDRHTIPPAVVAMTIVCGLMAFGMKGVFIGPLLVIFVMTVYNTFGEVPKHAVHSRAEAAHDEKNKKGAAASVKQDAPVANGAPKRPKGTPTATVAAPNGNQPRKQSVPPPTSRDSPPPTLLSSGSSSPSPDRRSKSAQRSKSQQKISGAHHLDDTDIPEVRLYRTISGMIFGGEKKGAKRGS